MIFKILGIALLLYAFKNYKNSFILFLCYKMFLNTNITLISIPGIPLLTLDMFMTLIYILIFIIRGNKYQYASMSFPFGKVFWMIGISYFISSIFSVAGLGAEFSNLIGSVSRDLLLIWVIWQIIDEKSDYIFLFKALTIIVLVSCIYGVIEFFLGSNPIIMYEATLNTDASKVIDYTYETISRGYRVQSIFEHTIGAGINWAMYLIFVLKQIIDKKEFPIKIISVLTALFCFVCLILTKQRGPLVFLLICALQLIDFRKRKFYFVFAGAVTAILLMLPFISQFSTVFLSIFNSAYQSNVGGSSIEMKIEQYGAAFQLLFKSPIFGLGYKFRYVMHDPLVSALRGMEGVWLSVITRYGLIGIISYVLYMHTSIVIIPKKFKSKEVFFYFLAYWVTYSISSVPGMHVYCLYLIVFYYIKESSKYSDNKSLGLRAQCYLNKNLRIKIRRA